MLLPFVLNDDAYIVGCFWCDCVTLSMNLNST